MMPKISGAVLAVSGSPAVSILVKVTVTMALGLFGARLARSSRAAVRHALLAVAFGALLVLPVASIVAPPVRIAVPVAAPARTVQPRVAGDAGSISPVTPPDAGAGDTPALSRWLRPSPSALLLTGWIAGAMLFLLPMAVGLWQVRSLRRSGLPWQHGQSVVDGLALDAGIHRRVEALLHEALPGPMTCGLLHPAIVLPPDAQNWEGEDLNRAIVHELEHVRRRDWACHCLARAVCAVYWFHPLVWIAWRQLALEAERACDDAVLGRSEAAAYADQLVGVAQRLSNAAKSPLLAMANRADLAARIRAVLDSRQQRGRAGVFPAALACAAAAMLVLTMSPLRVVAAPQEVKATPVPQFSGNAMLVIDAVKVSDKNGRSINGLKANDFAVTEDGVPQTISVFEFQKLAATAQEIQDSISSYYIVGYYTANQDRDGKFRNVKITLKEDSAAKLNYRLGYYAVNPFGPNGNAHGGVANSVGLDLTSLVLLYKKEPEYSEEARKAKYQGSVVLFVEVNGSGQVTNIKVMRSLGLGLDEKAIEAVRQWKFKPVMKNGELVTVQAQVEMNFRLL